MDRRHEDTGSIHASTVYVQLPTPVGVTSAPQRSLPRDSSRIGVHGPGRSSGPRSTTLAATAAWPSPKSVAETSNVSPGTAFAGRLPQSTAGSTSTIGTRPVTVPGFIGCTSAVLEAGPLSVGGPPGSHAPRDAPSLAHRLGPARGRAQQAVIDGLRPSGDTLREPTGLGLSGNVLVQACRPASRFCRTVRPQRPLRAATATAGAASGGAAIGGCSTLGRR